jgi:GR25 family glycosyltransferase involved in LPS biosynthesis
MSSNSSDCKNIDIYSIPVYYISFGKNLKLEKLLSEQGFLNINHFEAVDGKKLKPDELKLQRKITFRVYNDLLHNRSENWGIPSLGAIGCTSSHNELWRKCVKENMEHIIIVENDLVFKKNFLMMISNSLNIPYQNPKAHFLAREHINLIILK